MDTQILWHILLQFILIALNAVFACAEIAVISMNDNKLSQMANEGNKKAIRLARLTDQPAKFLATIQVGITAVNLLGSAFAADNFSALIAEGIKKTGVGIPDSVIKTLSVILITAILLYFTVVFGELVPKRIAMRNSEKIALALSRFVTLISSAFRPVVWILTASTNGILKLLGIDPDMEDEQVSEEEIRMMIDIGNQKGVIDSEEKEMIQNVFEFDDLTVGEFATHRTNISLLWMDETPEDWDKTIHESRHSLYPVCSETVDKVVGILSAKDYFRIKDKTRENIIEGAVKPAYFIPESIRADILFRHMKKSRNHFAVVIDEYGGVSGIVTINDLLEQLVGDLEDEDSPRDEEAEFEQIDSGTWKIRGSMFLGDVAEKLKVKLPVEDYDTFGGFIFGSYGSIPDDGSEFEIDIPPLHIKVTEIKERRIEKAIVHIEKD